MLAARPRTHPLTGVFTKVARRTSFFTPGNNQDPPHPARVTMLSDSPPPPTKQSLKTWWTSFTSQQKAQKSAEGKGTLLVAGYRVGKVVLSMYGLALDEHPSSVFGKPLKESLRYASVQISTANANGELYVWGYIPVVVAKWCVCLYVHSLESCLNGLQVGFT